MVNFLFLIKCSWYGANDAAPAIFAPYPGSSLFNQLEKEGLVSLNDENYFFEMIETYNIIPNKVYTKNLSLMSIRLYLFLFLIIFYLSNYIFRPERFFKTIKNILTGKQESKIEQIVQTNLIKPFLSFQKKN